MKVLMATYQGERYIRQQIDSILGQTVGGIQIVISDDLSQDGTRDVIEEYKRNYPDQILLLNNRKASNGASANFMRLLSWALRETDEGDEYFFLSDQDDVWMPDKARRMLDQMEELEKEWGKETPLLVHSDMKVAGQDLSEIHQSFFAYQHISPERTALNQLLVENPVTGGASMFNRALLSYLDRQPRECFMHDWWLALLASCFGRIGCVSQPLSCYRQHGGNTLGAQDSREMGRYWKRFSREKNAQVKENYRKMFAQASCLLELFSEELSGEQKELLRAFLRLPSAGLIERAALIRRYHFEKNTWLGTAAQCFTMKQ